MMLPYQERVVKEHDELCQRIDSLIVFLQGDLETITDAQQELLKKQIDVMMEYRKILIQRMAYFGETCTESS
jgi:hypothetical protein